MIPRDVYEKVNDHSTGKGDRERGMILLDCVEARSKVVPSDFVELVRVLESDRFLEPLAIQLIENYCSEFYTVVRLGAGSSLY